jgi:hypothetical protein
MNEEYGYNLFDEFWEQDEITLSQEDCERLDQPPDPATTEKLKKILKEIINRPACKAETLEDPYTEPRDFIDYDDVGVKNETQN